MRVGSGLSKLTTRKKTNAASLTGAKNLLPTFQEYILWMTSHAAVVREMVSMQVIIVWLLRDYCMIIAWSSEHEW